MREGDAPAEPRINCGYRLVGSLALPTRLAYSTAMDQAHTDRLMHIAVSGSTGLVGSALCHKLREQGRDARRIVRRSAGEDHEILWDTSTQSFDAVALAKCDAVVHLAGENIMGRWTQEKKQRVLGSRVDSTRALAKTLTGITGGPRTLVVASAIGYYGDTGQTDPRTEDDPPGSGFMPDVCVQWEQAADPARDAGLRVVHVRIGIVLSPKGGALAQMLPPFKLGLGGPIGDGTQWMSWVTLHDLVRVLVFCIDTPAVAGPVNAVAPEPVTNRQFTKALGDVLHRPAVIPVPGFAPKLLYGSECAEALVLGSIRVVPKRLLDAGFIFDYPDLKAALQHELKH